MTRSGKSEMSNNSFVSFYSNVGVKTINEEQKKKVEAWT